MNPELIQYILVPILIPIISLLVEKGKKLGFGAPFLLANLSIVAGCLYVIWSLILPVQFTAWVLAAVPVFGVGAMYFYAIAKVVMKERTTQ